MLGMSRFCPYKAFWQKQKKSGMIFFTHKAYFYTKWYTKLLGRNRPIVIIALIYVFDNLYYFPQNWQR